MALLQLDRQDQLHLVASLPVFLPALAACLAAALHPNPSLLAARCLEMAGVLPVLLLVLQGSLAYLLVVERPAQPVELDMLLRTSLAMSRRTHS